MKIAEKTIIEATKAIMKLYKAKVKFRPKLYNDGSPDKPVTDAWSTKGNTCIGWGIRIHEGIVDPKNKLEKAFRDSRGNLKSFSQSALTN